MRVDLRGPNQRINTKRKDFRNNENKLPLKEERGRVRYTHDQTQHNTLATIIGVSGALVGISYMMTPNKLSEKVGEYINNRENCLLGSFAGEAATIRQKSNINAQFKKFEQQRADEFLDFRKISSIDDFAISILKKKSISEVLESKDPNLAYIVKGILDVLKQSSIEAGDTSLQTIREVEPIILDLIHTYIGNLTENRVDPKNKDALLSSIMRTINTTVEHNGLELDLEKVISRIEKVAQIVDPSSINAKIIVSDFKKMRTKKQAKIAFNVGAASSPERTNVNRMMHDAFIYSDVKESKRFLEKLHKDRIKIEPNMTFASTMDYITGKRDRPGKIITPNDAFQTTLNLVDQEELKYIEDMAFRREHKSVTKEGFLKLWNKNRPDGAAGTSKFNRGFVTFNKLYESTKNTIYNDYVDDVFKIVENSGEKTKTEIDKELHDLRSKYITSISFKRQKHIYKGQEISNAIEQRLVLNDANSNEFRSINTAFNLPYDEFLENEREQLALKVGIGNIIFDHDRLQYMPEMSFYGVDNAISIGDVQRDQVIDFLPKVISSINKDKNKQYNALDFIELKAKMAPKPIYTIYDVLKSNMEVKSQFLKGVAAPHTLSYRDRRYFSKIGTELHNYADILEHVHDKNKYKKFMVVDTETFGLDDKLSEMDSLHLFSPEGKRLGIKGHAYTVAFTGFRSQDKHTIFENLAHNKIIGKMMSNKTVLLDKDKSGKPIYKNIVGQVVVREAIEDMFKLIEEAEKEASIDIKKLKTSDIKKLKLKTNELDEILAGILKLQPTDYMKTKEGFVHWIKEMYSKRDKYTTPFKDVQAAILNLSKSGYDITGFNGIFDMERMNLQHTVKITDIMYMAMGIGTDAKNNALATYGTAKSTEAIMRLFGITDNEVQNVIRTSLGNDAAGGLHFGPYDTALEALILKRIIEEGHGKKQSVPVIHKIADLMLSAARGEYSTTHMSEVVGLTQKMAEFFKNGTSLFDGINFLGSAEAGSKGILYKNNKLMYNLTFFTEASGMHKQLYQTFNSVYTWRAPGAKLRVESMLDKQLISKEMATFSQNAFEVIGYSPLSPNKGGIELAKESVYLFSPNPYHLGNDARKAMGEGVVYSVGNVLDDVMVDSRFTTKFSAINISIIGQEEDPTVLLIRNAQKKLKNIYEQLEEAYNNTDNELPDADVIKKLKDQHIQIVQELNDSLKLQRTTNQLKLYGNDKEIRLNKYSLINKIILDEQGIITDIEAYESNKATDINLKLAINDVKGVVNKLDNDINLKDITKGIRKSFNIKDGYFLVSGEYALNKERRGGLYLGMIGLAKVKGADLESVLKGMDTNQFGKDANLYTNRLLKMLGYTYDAAQDIKIDEWLSDLTYNKQSGIEKSMGFYDFMFEYIKRGYVNSGNIMNAKDIQTLERLSITDKRNYIYRLKDVFPSKLINVNSYTDDILSDNVKFIDKLKQDFGTGGDSIAKILTPVLKDNGDLMDFAVHTIGKFRALEDLGPNAAIISPGRGAELKFKALDTLFVADLMEGKTVAERISNAKQFMTTYQKDLALYNAYNSMRKGIKKSSINYGSTNVIDGDSIIAAHTKLLTDRSGPYKYKLGDVQSSIIDFDLSLDDANQLKKIHDMLDAYNKLTAEAGEKIKDKADGMVYFHGQFDTIEGFLKKGYDIDTIRADGELVTPTRAMLLAETTKAELKQALVGDVDLAKQHNGVIPLTRYKYDSKDGLHIDIVFASPHLRSRHTLNHQGEEIIVDTLNLDAAYSMPLLNAIMDHKKLIAENADHSTIEAANRNIQNLNAKYQRDMQRILYQKGAATTEATTIAPHAIRGTAKIITPTSLNIKEDGPFVLKSAFNYLDFVDKLKDGGIEIDDYYSNLQSDVANSVNLLDNKNKYRMILDENAAIGEEVIFKKGIKGKVADVSEVTKYMKEKGNHSLKLHSSMNGVGVSYPVTNLNLPMDMYITNTIKAGAIGMDYYSRRVILKDWDSDVVSMMITGFTSFRNKFVMNRAKFMETMEDKYGKTLDEMLKIGKDIIEEDTSANKLVLNFADHRSGEKDGLLSFMKQLFPHTFDSTNKASITENEFKNMSADEIMMGIKGAYPDLVADNEIYLFGHEYKGKKFESIIMKFGTGEHKTSIGGIEKSFMGKEAGESLTDKIASKVLSFGSRITEATLEATEGKKITPTGYFLSRTYKAMAEQAQALAEEMADSDSETSKNLSNKSLLFYELAIKSIKGNANKGEGSNLLGAIEQIKQNNDPSLLRKFINPFVRSKKEADALDSILGKVGNIMKESDTLAQYSMYEKGNEFFNFGNFNSLGQKKAFDMISEIFRPGQGDNLFSGSSTKTFQEQITKTMSNMHGIRGLAIAGSVIAAIGLFNSDQTPWYDDRAVTPGDYTEDINFSTGNPIRLKDRDFSAKNRMIDSISRQLQNRQELYLFRSKQVNGIIEDRRNTRSQKNRFLSI